MVGSGLEWKFQGLMSKQTGGERVKKKECPYQWSYDQAHNEYLKGKSLVERLEHQVARFDARLDVLEKFNETWEFTPTALRELRTVLQDALDQIRRS